MQLRSRSWRSFPVDIDLIARRVLAFTRSAPVTTVRNAARQAVVLASPFSSGLSFLFRARPKKTARKQGCLPHADVKTLVALAIAVLLNVCPATAAHAEFV